jgi:hypothetical protein
MSTAEPLPRVAADDSEAPATAAEDARPEPGLRVVDGRLMYSAAWIDFEAPAQR